MYNIIEQHQNQSSRGRTELAMTMMLNDSTKSSPPVLTTTSGGFKIDCAKECPCNVPVIPVPDQFLEVMVTGGFKEIEADLMRTNLTAKFRDYLQEFPNEPTTFLEALKKVQELEERWANEQDDTGAKKRMGWLKLRGKDKGAGGGGAGAGAPEAASGELAGKETADGSAPPAAPESVQTMAAEPAGQQQLPAQDERVAEPSASATTAGPINTTTTTSKDQPAAGTTTSMPAPSSTTNEATKKKKHTTNNNNLDSKTTLTTPKQPVNENASGDGVHHVKIDKTSGQHRDTSTLVLKKPLAPDLKSAKLANVSDRASLADKEQRQSSFVKLERAELAPPGSSAETTAIKSHKTTKTEKAATKQRASAAPLALEEDPGRMVAGPLVAANEHNVDTTTANAASNRPAKTRRKRDKPNLSRTKAAHVGSRGESIEAGSANILAIPVASHRRPHHHHHNPNHDHRQQQHLDTTDGQQQQQLLPHKLDSGPPLPMAGTVTHREARTDKSRSNRQTRTTKRGDSTIIHIANIDSGPR